MPDFNPITMKYKKTLKEYAAYLVEQDGQPLVLKAEVTVRGTTNTGVGQKRGPRSAHRGAWLQRHEGKSPEVKKSIEIAANIIAYVCEEGSFAAIRTLTGLEVSVVAQKLSAQAQHLRDDGETGADNLRAMVWYTMPCFKSFLDLEKRPPEEIITALREHPETFESLGRILVCDAFLCNADRLGALTKREDEYRPYGPTVQSKNIFLTWYPLRFFPLDFFDTQLSQAATMGNTWQQAQRDFQGSAVGALLLHNFGLLHTGKTKERDRAAEAAMYWFGRCFTPRIDFGQEAVDAVRAGFREGRERLHSFCTQRILVEKWPSGLKSRFKACGW